MYFIWKVMKTCYSLIFVKKIDNYFFYFTDIIRAIILEQEMDTGVPPCIRVLVYQKYL